MADKLIEQWRLAVLRVRLDLTERKPAVDIELFGHPEGTRHMFWRRRFSLEAFGLTNTARTPDRLTVPDELPAAVISTLRNDFPGQAALWLRLAPPYGYLGAVPWEERIVQSDLPLLRVPDLLPAATDPGQAWSVAVAIDAVPGADWVAPYVTGFVTALHTVIESRVDVHVFADAASHEVIRKALSGIPGGEEVHLPEPSDARRLHAERSTRDIRQFRGTREHITATSGLLWADWIAASLKGRAVRALHVVAGAALDAGRPLLTVSPNPNEPVDHADQTYVSADEMRGLADAVGAAAVSFGSPPDNPSDIATRMMADDVGRNRAGSTLYSSLRLDPHGETLARTHAFLANRPGADLVPRHRSLFAYLQPELVNAVLSEPWRSDTSAGYPNVDPDLLPTTSTGDEVSRHFAAADEVPVWVAAAERYIDTRVADIVRSAPPEGEGLATKRAYLSGTADALTELRELVARHVRRS